MLTKSVIRVEKEAILRLPPRKRIFLLFSKAPCTIILNELKVTCLDQFKFLGNYPPTPPLSQHYHVVLTKGKILG